MIIEPLEHIFFQRAVLVAGLIGLCNGYISSYVVFNKSALVMNSLSHSLLPGIAVAALIASLTPPAAFIGALSAALIIGSATIYITKFTSLDKNTVLAILYTTTFAMGIFIVQFFPIHVELESWLFGNILGVSNFDLHVSFFTTFGVLFFLTLYQRPLIIMIFEPSVAKAQGIHTQGLNYLLFGALILSLISSLQAVGCTLAVGLMVAPASIANLFSNSPVKIIWSGAIIGMIISIGSVITSYYINTPPGPLIIIVCGGVFLLSLIISPKSGLFKRFRKLSHS